MMEYLKQRQVITIPYAKRSYLPRLKDTATKRHNLITLTRPNREKSSYNSQLRTVNVGPLSKAKPRTWLATLRAKELEAVAFWQASTKLARASANKSFLSHEDKYCAICTPLGKLCSNEFPGSQDSEDSKEEEGNDQVKKINSLCVLTGMQISKDKIEKIKK